MTLKTFKLNFFSFFLFKISCAHEVSDVYLHLLIGTEFRILEVFTADITGIKEKIFSQPEGGYFLFFLHENRFSEKTTPNIGQYLF